MLFLEKIKKLKETNIPSPEASWRQDFPRVELVQVTPVYAELGGNIEEMLEAMVVLPQEIREKVLLIFVVNNPKVLCWLDEIIGDKTLKELISEGKNPLDIEKELIKRKHLEPRYENSRGNATASYIAQLFYTWIDLEQAQTGAGLEAIFRKRAAYQENQATLGLLKTLAIWTDRLKVETNPAYKHRLRQQGLEAIKTSWQQYFPDRPLSRIWKLALRRELNLRALDYSSEATAFRSADIGLARQVGAKMAEDLAPNYRYIRFADADTVSAPEWWQRLFQVLGEIEAKSQKSASNLILPLPQLTIPEVPEQYDDMSPDLLYPHLLNVILSTINRGRSYAGVTDKQLGGSQLLVSRKAYNQHQYPRGSMNSDFAFSEAQVKAGFKRHYPDLSPIHLKNRYRSDSIDGSHAPGGKAELDFERTMAEFPEKSLENAQKILVSFGTAIEYLQIQWLSRNFDDLVPWINSRISDSAREVEKQVNLIRRHLNLFVRAVVGQLGNKSQLDEQELIQALPPRSQDFYHHHPLFLRTLVALVKRIERDYHENNQELIFADFIKQEIEGKYFRFLYDLDLTELLTLDQVRAELQTVGSQEYQSTYHSWLRYYHLVLVVSALNSQIKDF